MPEMIPEHRARSQVPSIARCRPLPLHPMHFFEHPNSHKNEISTIAYWLINLSFIDHLVCANYSLVIEQWRKPLSSLALMELHSSKKRLNKRSVWPESVLCTLPFQLAHPHYLHLQFHSEPTWDLALALNKMPVKKKKKSLAEAIVGWISSFRLLVSLLAALSDSILSWATLVSQVLSTPNPAYLLSAPGSLGFVVIWGLAFFTKMIGLRPFIFSRSPLWCLQ